MDFYAVHSCHRLYFFCNVPKKDVAINGNVDKDLASPVCLPT